jgi:hypothetical protein
VAWQNIYWAYGAKITVQAIIPPRQPIGTYTWQIVYTLIAN